jgi:hypothetical protein
MFSRLRMDGSVHYEPESSAHPGQIRASADKLTCSLQGLALGGDQLSLHANLARLERADLFFEGTRVVQAQCALVEVALTALSFGAPA